MRVLIACARPAGNRADGLAWLRAQLVSATVDPGVQAVTLTELQPAGRAPLVDALLIEVAVAEGCDYNRLVEKGSLGRLRAELRSLRLDPSVALAPDPVGIIRRSDRA
jgi:hypothetical protein